MRINIHAGHNPEGKVACGARGILDESPWLTPSSTVQSNTSCPAARSNWITLFFTMGWLNWWNRSVPLQHF